MRWITTGAARRGKRSRIACRCEARSDGWETGVRNAYVQSRLQTALAVDGERYFAADARLLYTQKLLYALGERRVTGADGLRLQRLQAEVAGFAGKKYYTAEQRALLARTLTEVMTLCARYGVEE